MDGYVNSKACLCIVKRGFLLWLWLYKCNSSGFAPLIASRNRMHERMVSFQCMLQALDFRPACAPGHLPLVCVISLFHESGVIGQRGPTQRRWLWRATNGAVIYAIGATTPKGCRNLHSTSPERTKWLVVLSKMVHSQEAGLQFLQLRVVPEEVAFHTSMNLSPY